MKRVKINQIEIGVALKLFFSLLSPSLSLQVTTTISPKIYDAERL